MENKKILLDTSVYINHFERQLNSVTVEEFKSVLNKNNFFLVASIYNIAELAGVDSLTQETRLLAKWIDEVSTLWIHDKWVLQCEEIKKFVYKNYYDHDYKFDVFTQHLSSCLLELQTRHNPSTCFASFRSGMQAESLLCNYHRDQDILKQSKVGCTQGAKNIREAVKGRIYDFENEEVFYKWIVESLFPIKSPDGQYISQNDKEILVKW